MEGQQDIYIYIYIVYITAIAAYVYYVLKLVIVILLHFIFYKCVYCKGSVNSRIYKKQETQDSFYCNCC